MNTRTDTQLTLYADADKFGPKMKALGPMQKQFVLAMLATGGKNQSEAARIAGYSHENVQGSRLAANPRVKEALIEQSTAYLTEYSERDGEVLDAIREEAASRIRAGAILGASALWEIAMDPMHKDRLKAAQDLLDRNDTLRVQHNQTIRVEHVTETTQDKVDKIVALARAQGIDPKQLLGDYGVIIDAEFKVVEAPAPGEVAGLLAPPSGIEDLLAL